MITIDATDYNLMGAMGAKMDAILRWVSGRPGRATALVNPTLMIEGWNL